MSKSTPAKKRKRNNGSFSSDPASRVPVSSAKYKFLKWRTVTRYPGKQSVSIPMYEMELDNLQHPFLVFDNLIIVKEPSDPPFYLGHLKPGSIPTVDFKTVAQRFKGNGLIHCHSNRNAFKSSLSKSQYEKRLSRPAYLVQTNLQVCKNLILRHENRERQCSHYLMTEITGGDELAALRELGLDILLNVSGILPWLNPTLQCISSVGFLVSEKGNDLGFHREDKLYCSVNLLITGEKKWTFIDIGSNVNFRTCTTGLVKSSNLDAELKQCGDPTQHKRFATFLHESNTDIVRYEFIQKPGDIVFVPCNVYHQVEVLQASVAVAFNTIDAEWTRLDKAELRPYCSDHDALHDFDIVESQRGAYALKLKYATEIDKRFLDATHLHPKPEEMHVFQQKMREIAIKDKAEKDARDALQQQQQSSEMQVAEDENQQKAEDDGSSYDIEEDNAMQSTSVSTADSRKGTTESNVAVVEFTNEPDLGAAGSTIESQEANVIETETTEAATTGNASGENATIAEGAHVIPNPMTLDPAVTDSSPPKFHTYDKSVGVKEKRMVFVELEATNKCKGCNMYFVFPFEAKYHCDKSGITCAYCSTVFGGPHNKKKHEDKCPKNPEIMKQKEEEQKKKEKYKRKDEILKIMKATELPKDEDLIGDGVKVKCNFCFKKFRFGVCGSGIRNHEKYCKKNPKKEYRAIPPAKPITKKAKPKKNATEKIPTSEEEPTSKKKGRSKKNATQVKAKSDKKPKSKKRHLKYHDATTDDEEGTDEALGEIEHDYEDADIRKCAQETANEDGSNENDIAETDRIYRIILKEEQDSDEDGNMQGSDDNMQGSEDNMQGSEKTLLIDEDRNPVAAGSTDMNPEEDDIF